MSTETDITLAYYYADDEQRVGPFSLDKLANMAHVGIIVQDVHVAVVDSDDWRPLNTLVEIKGSLEPTSPSPPIRTEQATPPMLPSRPSARTNTPLLDEGGNKDDQWTAEHTILILRLLGAIAVAVAAILLIPSLVGNAPGWLRPVLIVVTIGIVRMLWPFKKQ